MTTEHPGVSPTGTLVEKTGKVNVGNRKFCPV